MDTSFNPEKIEQDLYQSWEKAGHFAPKGEGDGYCILIPPPNVTGTLHMGHAFNQTLMDSLIRYQRMLGNRTLWQMGTDHAGIATQMLVERQIASEGSSRHELGREAFIERVWEWKKQSGGTISKQIRRMGSSIDWTRERFTMDDGYAEAVQTAFIQLFDQGLIYRGTRLVNWDPELGTAISDLEVENKEEQGFLWHFRYPLAGGAKTKEGDDFLVVATTRPETMLGDTAVAVHPDDERYAHLIGATITLPLVGREIPVIADDYVDMAFGTGCVKITPAHDFNDNEMGARHNLESINILTPEAKINGDAPEPYRGLDRVVARKQIVADLDALDLLAAVEDHKLMVPRGDRSNAIIEPYLTDQWFVKIAPLAEPAIKAVEDGSIKFVPKQYENTYFSWMRDIQDWCISRQQWWGHRIPAFYDEAGNIYAAEDEASARKKYALSDEIKLSQDNDVLETWFSSALWPMATLGWPERHPDLEDYLPSSTLVTGHDIIFFWVARMIMMTLHFQKKVPFDTVYIHGLVRDFEGQKMSKSKGNGLDPLDFIDGVDLETLVAKRTNNLTQPKMAKRIEKQTRKDFPEGVAAYGTDALRFTFCALATTGRDVRFDTNRIEGYRNFCNKLWNASKFVLMNTENVDLTHAVDESTLSSADRWILSKTRRMVEDAKFALETYRFDIFASSIYEFAWHEYCDWYLELTKSLLWNEDIDPALKKATQRTLLEVLDTMLRTAHPVMPFITETLWQQVAPRLGIIPASHNAAENSIMLQSFPDPEKIINDPAAEEQIEWLKAVITGIRNIRGEANIKPSKEITVLLQGGSPADRVGATESSEMLMRLANIAEITWLKDGDTPPANALSLVGELKVMVPLAGLIDVAAEQARINKEVERIRGEIERIDNKLSNESFVAKAPAEVVEKERARAAEFNATLGTLSEQMAQLASLA
ncbi:MAG: valine--tRNA ligase [Pseudomonadales bacterium]|nr:valine--tRNA ligase [Pseudomonadales bacterium]